MHPVHDVDAALLLALSLAAKRRPASLAEIVATFDLTQGAVPSEHKLSAAFARLSACGLLAGADGGYTLPAAAQELMSSQRKKDDFAQRMARLKEQLAGYRAEGEHAAVQVNLKELLAAILAFRKDKAANRSPVKEKPKTAWIPRKELLQGKPLPRSKRRKD